MAWEESSRRSRLPPNWEALRKPVLFRPDGSRRTCRWIEKGRKCPELATEVDHIKPGDDHSPSNLRGLCTEHHLRKSSREGHAAKATKRAAISRKFRRTEQHPGRLGLKDK